MRLWAAVTLWAAATGACGNDVGGASIFTATGGISGDAGSAGQAISPGGATGRGGTTQAAGTGQMGRAGRAGIPGDGGSGQSASGGEGGAAGGDAIEPSAGQGGDSKGGQGEGGQDDGESGASGAPSPGGGAGQAQAGGGAGSGGTGASGTGGALCECSSGECCDGCHFRARSYFLGEKIYSTRCEIASPDSCPGYSKYIYEAFSNQFCCGDSATCTRWAMTTQGILTTKEHDISCKTDNTIVCIETNGAPTCQPCPP